MTLFERISSLIRSNLNDLMEKTEDHEKTVKQIILNIEKELRELKGQMAVSITDLHMLEQKLKEYRDKMADWMHKAELSLDLREEAVARDALQHHVSFQQLAREAEEQVLEQKGGVEGIKALLVRLEQKLEEVRSKGEILAVQGRRSRALDKAMGATAAAENTLQSSGFDQLRQEIEFAAMASRARVQLTEEDFEEKLQKMVKDQEVDSLLADLKRKRGMTS
jgi:phage shock protein A